MVCSTIGSLVPHCLPEFAQIHVYWVNGSILSSHLLLHPSPPALNLSQHQGLFQWVALCIRWPKYWSFRISPSSEYSGLISFRTDWFDLAVQGTLKSQKHQFFGFSLLYSPTFTSVHDYQENHSLFCIYVCMCVYIHVCIHVLIKALCIFLPT